MSFEYGLLYVSTLLFESDKIIFFSVKKLEKMGELYKLSGVRNSEVRCSWIRLGLKGRWRDAIPRAVQMVTDQGRMKFLRPIYR